MIDPSDFSPPYEERGKWLINEKLQSPVTESRGDFVHEFSHKRTAELFYNLVKKSQ